MREYSIKLSADELNVIGTSLSEAPYRVAAPVLARLQEQVRAQDAAHQTASDKDASDAA